MYLWHILFDNVPATVNIDHDDKHFLQKVVTSFIVIDELGFAYVI